MENLLLSVVSCHSFLSVECVQSDACCRLMCGPLPIITYQTKVAPAHYPKGVMAKSESEDHFQLGITCVANSWKSLNVPHQIQIVIQIKADQLQSGQHCLTLLHSCSMRKTCYCPMDGTPVHHRLLSVFCLATPTIH